MKTIIFLAAIFILALNSASGQESKFFLRTFPSYKIDTVRIEGNPILMKRHVISVLQQAGVKSAFWDETNNILTVEYDDGMVRLRDIRNYFYKNVRAKHSSQDVRLRLDYQAP